MGGACSTNGEKRNEYRLLVGKARGKEDQDVGGWIILGWIFRVWMGLLDWIGLAQDMNRWSVLVNSLMNLLVP
jgi:hypothetical protein